MTELVDIASQFRGLPMADLIGAPLTAACDAQIRLANATADFIKYIGFEAPTTPGGTPDKTRTANFQFKRLKQDPANPGVSTEEDVTLNVPLLAIVKVPSLAITKVDITFDMEVKSSFSAKESQDTAAKLTAEASAKIGPFSVTVHVEGSVAAHKENTRTSDNSAKYHVQVLAEDSGMPEGLARVLDMMQSAIQPKVSAAPAAKNP